MKLILLLLVSLWSASALRLPTRPARLSTHRGALLAAPVEINVPEQKWVTIPDIYETLSKAHPSTLCLHDPVHPGKVKLTYKQTHEQMLLAAGALQGLRRKMGGEKKELMGVGVGVVGVVEVVKEKGVVGVSYSGDNDSTSASTSVSTSTSTSDSVVGDSSDSTKSGKVRCKTCTCGDEEEAGTSQARFDAAKAKGELMIGLRPTEVVSVFADNSHRWLITEQAVMKCGGASAVRGRTAPSAELGYIYRDSGSVAAVVEDEATLRSFLSSGVFEGGDLPRFLVVLFSGGKTGMQVLESMARGEEEGEGEGGGGQGDSVQRSAAALLSAGVPVLTYEELLFRGAGRDSEFRQIPKTGNATATIVYTSGTTAQPKGACLSHANLLYQVAANAFSLPDASQDLNPKVGDVFLTILPCWHVFERAAAYFMMARGVSMVYSSLPTFKSDLTTIRPHYLIAVPRLYDTTYKGVKRSFKEQTGVKALIIAFAIKVTTIFKNARQVARGLVVGPTPSPLRRLAAYLLGGLLFPLQLMADFLVWRKIRAGLGGRMKIMVSGGSLLSPQLEVFFRLTGLNLLAGYGLTETSPVVCAQIAERRSVGSIGPVLPGTVVKVVHPETRDRVPEGQEGVLMVKGPGVFAGYINNPTATEGVFDAEGYFDTGDLVRIANTGEVVITGRYKDTIVLLSGENVAPQPIEERICENDMADAALLLGQDQKFLSALVVVNVAAMQKGGLIDAQRAEHLTGLLRAAEAEGAAGVGGGVGAGAGKGVGVGAGVGGAGVEVREGGAVLGPASLQLLRASRELNADSRVRNAVLGEILKTYAPVKPCETVRTVILGLENPSLKNGLLTQTLKLKRHAVVAAYKDQIEEFLFK